MGKFMALLGLNLRSMLFSFNVSSDSKKNKARSFTGVGVLVLMGGLGLYLSSIYSFLFGSQLAPVGMLPLLLMMMPLLAVAAGMMFTTLAAQGVVFGGHDNDLMLSLPISAFSLLLSRVLALYLENLVFTTFIMLPAGAAYLYYGGSGGVAFVLTLLVCTPFLALLPTLFALVCGFALSWLSSKFPRKALVSLVLYLALFMLTMVAVFKLNSLMGEMGAQAMGISAAFSGWGLPFVLFSEAVCDANLLSLLVFCALCLLPFFLVVWLFAGQYKKIITGLTARSVRSDYKLLRLAAGSQRKALLAKEAAKFFGTPIYLFNAGIGLIMLLGASVFSLFQKSAIVDVLAQLGGELPILPLLALTLGFMLSTVGITACSISLEGRQLWILREAPIAVNLLFLVKAGFQLLLTLPCLLVSVVCVMVSFSLAPMDALLLFVLGAALAAFSAPFGLFVNLCLPKLDAANDTVVVKQSSSAIIGIFAPMLLVGAGVGLYLLTMDALGTSVALWLCAAMLAVTAAGMWALLVAKGQKLFAAL
ncbi:MAG: hypothetical protein RR022_01505 [Angelakisella sp.]